MPKTYLGTEKGEVARVTKGMAMALKARMLLYAASPLNNPGGDAGRYLEAAAAAKELIDAGIYKLVSEETTNNADAQGLIFGKWCPVSSDFEAANFPVGTRREFGRLPVAESQPRLRYGDGRTVRLERRVDAVADVRCVGTRSALCQDADIQRGDVQGTARPVVCRRP